MGEELLEALNEGDWIEERVSLWKEWWAGEGVGEDRFARGRKARWDREKEEEEA